MPFLVSNFLSPARPNLISSLTRDCSLSNFLQKFRPSLFRGVSRWPFMVTSRENNRARARSVINSEQRRRFPKYNRAHEFASRGTLISRLADTSESHQFDYGRGCTVSITRHPCYRTDVQGWHCSHLPYDFPR